MRLFPAEKNWPSFNDKPHERPVLTQDGEGRALVILMGIFGGLPLLSLVLSWLA